MTFIAPRMITTPLTVTPEFLSVVDGNICLEFTPTDNAAFFRFNVD